MARRRRTVRHELGQLALQVVVTLVAIWLMFNVVQPIAVDYLTRGIQSVVQQSPSPAP
jgi:hypothetical protein